MKFSIRTKLILFIMMPLMSIYFIVLVLDYRISKAAVLRHMKEHLTELVAHHAAHFDGRFSTMAQVAQAIATFLSSLPDTNEKQLYELLRNVVKNTPRLYGACIAFEPNKFYPDRPRFAPYVCRDKEGLRILDVGRESYDYTTWDWYLVPKLLDQPIWTDPYYDVGAGNALMCTYCVPFKKDGALWGVTTVDISLENLRDEMEKVSIAQGYCAIIGQNGVFVSHPDPALIMRETMFSLAEWYEAPEYAELGRQMMAGARDVRRILDFRTSKPKWVVFAPVHSCGWSFAAVIPEDQLLAPVYADLRRNTVLLLLEMGLVACIILWVAIRITRPISRLATAVSRVATGDLNVQATGIRSGDEIGHLAQAFNKMVSDLKAHVAALTRETAARESVESELRIARNIQESFLPRTFPPFPDHKEFDLHAVNAPAKQVAGDFFDFYFLSDEILLVTIADVSGKGVPAALFMAVTRTLLKNLAQGGLGPSEALKRVNQLLAQENDESMFVTLFLALYNTRTGRLRYANAGHNPPYHMDSHGKLLTTLPATGPPLAVVDEMEIQEGEIALGVGDLLVLYTDGVTEAHSEGGKLFGEENFLRLLSQLTRTPLDQVCQTVVKTVNDYQQGNQYDDITLLVLRRNV